MTEPVSTQSETLRAAAARVDENNPERYWVPLPIAQEHVRRLREALEWTLAAYKDALASKPTPGADVVSHAEKALRDAD